MDTESFLSSEMLWGMLIAFIVIFFTAVFWFVRRKQASRQFVLLLGLSDSGKTVLFSKLISSKNVKTYTSMKENVSSITVEKQKPLKLVDIPGNERLRTKFLDGYKNLARAVIFVVDSATLSREIRDVAELLYHVLIDQNLSSVPMMIACNKQDETMAKSGKVIKSQLEKELNTLRVTHSAALDSTSDNRKNASTFLGNPNKDFQFSDLKSALVEFVECSVDHVDKISKWLNTVA